MNISMSVSQNGVDVTISEEMMRPRMDDTNNLAVAAGMVRVIKRTAQALDVDFMKVMKDVVEMMTPSDDEPPA